jgi:hypothetical protein
MNKLNYTYIFCFITVASFIFLCCAANASEKQVVEEQEKVASIDHSNSNAMPTDYLPVPLSRLIASASLGVLGTITGVEEAYFYFQIDEFIVNEQPERNITVTKYIPLDMFLPRSLPYAANQRFILFLKEKEVEGTDPLWEIIGAAGEGELPVDDQYVYLEGHDLQGLASDVYPSRGGVRAMQRFDLEEFLDAATTYKSCFSWELIKYFKNNKERQRWQAFVHCDDEQRKSWADRSWMHNYLLQETMKKNPQQK